MKAKVKEKENEKELNDNLEIEDVPGIGPTKAEKLKENGLYSVFDLASAQMDDLSIALGVSKDTATQFINSAQTLLRDNGFLSKEWTSASTLLVKRQTVERIKTGSEKLDLVLGGGIETQAVTEFYGEYGSGKSQICHMLCGVVQQPKEQGGLESNAVFVDTEGTFRADRLDQICNAHGWDTEKILNNTFVSPVFNAGHLELLVKGIGHDIERFHARLLVVDSLTSQHRADFIGRGTLNDRQQRLNQIMHKLVRVASMYNVAVVVTNQVISDPGVMFGDPTKPVGGHIVGHASTYRLSLKKAGHDRIVTMVDSPSHPYRGERFLIDESGIKDIAEDKKKK
jgi:DNA repair protein RadA